jgi:hypothetical protein
MNLRVIDVEAHVWSTLGSLTTTVWRVRRDLRPGADRPSLDNDRYRSDQCRTVSVFDDRLTNCHLRHR